MEPIVKNQTKPNQNKTKKQMDIYTQIGSTWKWNNRRGDVFTQRDTGEHLRGLLLQAYRKTAQGGRVGIGHFPSAPER